MAMLENAGNSSNDVEKMQPVCLVKQVEHSLEVCQEGIKILEAIKEPVAVICLAGQYRTGKSFFLNQLTGQEKCKRKNSSTTDSISGFTVGTTTESCTRGIWLWDPMVSSLKGEKVLLMDTEELSKQVCVSSAKSGNEKKTANGTMDDDQEFTEELQDRDEEELARHFPPFLWLLRDFMLNMEVDGKMLKPNEYLENALEDRVNGSSRRLEERNRIRKSLRTLFPSRECWTLVRPAIDETKLRNAYDLHVNDLRPEFVSEMEAIRKRIFSIVQPKKLLDHVLHGPQLANLVHTYTDAMNSGSVPDIKGAWEYVAQVTCSTALEKATLQYDEELEKLMNESPLVDQNRFDQMHKSIQEDVLNLFKLEAVDGTPARMQCFQRLKLHIQKNRANHMKILMGKSREICQSIIQKLSFDENGLKPTIANIGEFGDTIDKDIFKSKMNEFYEKYEEKAEGPAKKTVLMSFVKSELLNFSSDFAESIMQKYETDIDDLHALYRQQLEDLHSEKDILEKKLHELEISYARMEEISQSQDDKIKSLGVTITDLKQTKAQLSEEFSLLKTEKLNVEAELNDLQKIQVPQLKQELAEISVRCEGLQSALEKGEKETMLLKKSHEDLLLHERNEREEERKLSEKNFNTQTSAFESSLAKATHLEEEIARLQKKYKTQSALVEEQNEIIQTDAEDLDALRIEIAEEKKIVHTLQDQICESTMASNLHAQELQDEKSFFEQMLIRTQIQLGDVSDNLDVQKVLEECICEVIRNSDREKNGSIIEERNLLQEKLGDLYLKISTLPDFYQRQVFCSQDSSPDFFDVLTDF